MPPHEWRKRTALARRWLPLQLRRQLLWTRETRTRDPASARGVEAPALLLLTCETVMYSVKVTRVQCSIRDGAALHSPRSLREGKNVLWHLIPKP